MATVGQFLLDASGKRNLGASGKARVSDGTDTCVTTNYRQVYRCSDNLLSGFYVPAFGLDQRYLRRGTTACYYQLAADATTTSPGTLLDFDPAIIPYIPNCDAYVCQTCTTCRTSAGHVIPPAFDVTITGWNVCTGCQFGGPSGVIVSGTINGTYRLSRGDPAVSSCWWTVNAGDLLGATFYDPAGTSTCGTAVSTEAYVEVSAYAGSSGGAGFFSVIVTYWYRYMGDFGWSVWQSARVFQGEIDYGAASSPINCDNASYSLTNLNTSAAACSPTPGPPYSATAFGGDGSAVAVPV